MLQVFSVALVHLLYERRFVLLFILYIGYANIGTHFSVKKSSEMREQRAVGPLGCGQWRNYR